jgi:hypothetical protein
MNSNFLAHVNIAQVLKASFWSIFSSVSLSVKHATFEEFWDVAACSPIIIDVLQKHCLIFRFKK